jgi:secondary thiamine-phosphate synthase enzyme
MEAAQVRHTIAVATAGQGFYDITGTVRAWLRTVRAEDGLLTLFIRHTSASLVIQENADPDVQTDLLTALEMIAPTRHPWKHSVEGPDDMPAHIRSMVTATSLSIPVLAGEPMLGTWQGIYVAEHRSAPHRRGVVLHYAGTQRT